MAALCHTLDAVWASAVITFAAFEMVRWIWCYRS